MKTITSKQVLNKLIGPPSAKSWSYDLAMAIPRVLVGLILSFEFGSSKFGMPWSTTDEMGLFEVVAWFPEDVSSYGAPFSLAPTLFAWLGAATEAIGGLFLAFGFCTRITGFLIAFTMLIAIFFQKWPDAMEYGSTWPLLPAAGFLWVAYYSIFHGSGRFGLDHLISRKLR